MPRPPRSTRTPAWSASSRSTRKRIRGPDSRLGRCRPPVGVTVFRVETIPLILGVLVAVLGVAIVADAWLPDEMAFRSDRRRQERAERSPGAEGCIGLAVLCLAAALVGRGTRPYGPGAMRLGGLLFLMGPYCNRHYLRGRIANRGARP